MNTEVFDQEVEAARRRLERITRSASRASPREAPHLQSAFEELSGALLELQVAVAEMERQRQEMATAHRTTESERRRYVELFQFAPDGCLTSDARGIIKEANQSVGKLLGVKAPFLLGKPLDRFLFAEDRRKLPSLMARLQNGEEVRDQEMHARPRQGEPIPVAVSGTGLSRVNSQASAVLWLVHDMRRLRRTDAVLRQLSIRLLHAQDEERRRIARELHDSTAQTLAAVKIHLNILKRNADSFGAAARNPLLKSITLVEESLREVRTLSTLLHPPLLDEMGLVPALGWYVKRFSEESGVRTGLEVAEGALRLPPDLEMALFRVAQEGLSNIRRHSGSETALVRLRADPGAVTLEVRDQGLGMPPEALEGLRARPDDFGLGILGMRERLDEMGGRLEIETGKNGTTVRAVLPVAHPGPAARRDSAAQPAGRRRSRPASH